MNICSTRPNTRNQFVFPGKHICTLTDCDHKTTFYHPTYVKNFIDTSSTTCYKFTWKLTTNNSALIFVLVSHQNTSTKIMYIFRFLSFGGRYISFPDGGTFRQLRFGNFSSNIFDESIVLMALAGFFRRFLSILDYHK